MDHAVHARKVQAAVVGQNDIIWRVFIYQCETCGACEDVGLGYGVEGPPPLRDKGTYIASPFMIGCDCGGLKCHARTLSIQPPGRPPIPGMRYFKVPDRWTEEHMRHYMSSSFSGDFATAPGKHGR